MVGSQKELAKELGISQMTVSRVLRGENGVGDSLRETILRRARALGFRVPEFRQRTPGDRAHVVCSMVPVRASAQDHADFHTRLLDGLQVGGRECGSDVMNHGDLSVYWPHIVTRRQVDGVIHVYGGVPRDRPVEPCPVPHVSLFNQIDESSDLVTVNNMDGARAIGEYLGSRGHRRVAFVGPTTTLSRDRLTGLKLGLQAAGGVIAPADISMEEGASSASVVRQVDDLIPAGTTPAALRARFTALAFYNDDMAGRGILHLRSRGFRVPEDISVTGFDGAAPSVFQDIHLTTAAIPLEDLGAEAVRLLYWRLDYPKAPVRRLVLSTRFVEGETVVKAGTL